MTPATTLSQCQLVIAAGGLATRLRPLSDKLPKSMIEVEGKPFLEHQIELVKAQGLKRILLLVGHLADQIEAYFGDGTGFGVSISYSKEPKPMGTAGALKLAEPLLDPAFFLMYGDAYLMIDLARLWERLIHSPREAVMAVFKNQHRWGRSNVVFDPPLVSYFQARLDLEDADPDMMRYHGRLEYIDYGVTAVKRQVLSYIPVDEALSMNEIFALLAEKAQLDGCEVFERFYEIGSHEGLEEFRNYLRTRAGSRPGSESDG